jgi:hypothetical protein
MINTWFRSELWSSTNIGIIVGFLLYFYARWSTRYFARMGLKYIPYNIPFIGNMCGTIMRKEHFRDLVSRIYSAFPKEK